MFVEVPDREALVGKLVAMRHREGDAEYSQWLAQARRDLEDPATIRRIGAEMARKSLHELNTCAAMAECVTTDSQGNIATADVDAIKRIEREAGPM
jgi:hypothetical protein